MRMAQMSLGLSGGFWPTSFPLFQASRLLMVSIFDSLVFDRSHMFCLHENGCCGGGWLVRANGQLRTVKHLPGSGRSRVSLTCVAPSMNGGGWPIRALTACQ